MKEKNEHFNAFDDGAMVREDASDDSWTSLRLPSPLHICSGIGWQREVHGSHDQVLQTCYRVSTRHFAWPFITCFSSPFSFLFWKKKLSFIGFIELNWKNIKIRLGIWVLLLLKKRNWLNHFKVLSFDKTIVHYVYKYTLEGDYDCIKYGIFEIYF